MPKELPIPKSWLARPGEGVEIPLAPRDLVVFGKAPAPGTKASLRMHLLAAGWQPEHFTPEAHANVARKLTLQGKTTDKELGTAHQSLLDDGFKVASIPNNNNWQQAIWESFTAHPWWVSSSSAAMPIVIASHNKNSTMTASSKFITDLHLNLGGPPACRMPVFTRVSLLSVSSPESLRVFLEQRGQEVDLLVVHGGVIDRDNIYHTLAYLSALIAGFKGLVIYEILLPRDEDLTPSSLAEIARRASFDTFFWI